MPNWLIITISIIVGLIIIEELFQYIVNRVLQPQQTTEKKKQAKAASWAQQLKVKMLKLRSKRTGVD